MAWLGARTGAGWAFDASGDKTADKAAEVLGQMRGLAAKVGQMASYVDGVVPESKREAFERALGALRAAAPTSDPEAICSVVEEELGQPPGELFAEWEDVPFASASIGQVHRARLADGRSVAVKVQHPGIAEAVEADLRNAGVMAGMKSLAFGSKMGIREAMDEMASVFREELDYRLEAERQQQFDAMHEADATIHVPEVIASHSAARVLTSVFVEGRSFEEACRAEPTLRRAWAQALWRYVFRSTLVGGLFNGDPHPGNFIFQDDGSITALDFGCVIPFRGEKQATAIGVHRAALDHDALEFDRQVRKMMELPPRGRGRVPKFHQAVLTFSERLFEPIAQSPFHITHRWAAGLVEECVAMAKQAIGTRSSEVVTMPEGMIFMNRLQFGFYSLLARLDVEVDYAAVEREILREVDAQKNSARPRATLSVGETSE